MTDNKPTAILTGDWHLREDIPKCRTDDFQKAQWKKVDFISELQKQYDCDVIHSGDLFDHWKPSPYLLSKTIEHLPEDFFTIYGNHDLPQHNKQLYKKSGIYTLEKAGVLQVIENYWWGEEPDTDIAIPMLIWHVMTYDGKAPWPGCTDLPARDLLKKYPNVPLILTGHNHKSFVVQDKNRILVNPGSITRQKADQINQVPCVYLWWKDKNIIKKVDLPYEPEVISREHIDRIKERDLRIEAFVQQLKSDWDADINFEENLERFIKENNIRESVAQIIWSAIGR